MIINCLRARTCFLQVAVKTRVLKCHESMHGFKVVWRFVHATQVNKHHACIENLRVLLH